MFAVAEKVLSLDTRLKLLLAGWDEAIEHYLDDGFLDEKEEKQLVSFAKHFGFTQSDLDKKEATLVLFRERSCDLMEVNSQRFHMDGSPFNFQKSESLIWGFNNVDYYEDKTRRQYVGGSQGKFSHRQRSLLPGRGFRGHQ